MWTIATAVSVIAWLLGHNPGAAFLCIAIQSFQERGGHHLNYPSFVIAFQVCNIALDTSILALPMSAVYRLRMPWNKKISVAATFLLGGLYGSSPLRTVRYLVSMLTSSLDPSSLALYTWLSIPPPILTFLIGLHPYFLFRRHNSRLIRPHCY